MSYLVSFCSCVFSPFSTAIISLGEEERANLSAFRTFVLVWICRFPLPLGVVEGLRFVIVALPGLFSYHFVKRFWIEPLQPDPSSIMQFKRKPSLTMKHAVCLSCNIYYIFYPFIASNNSFYFIYLKSNLPFDFIKFVSRHKSRVPTDRPQPDTGCCFR